MSILSNVTAYSASEARDRLYSLIKSTARGTRAIEINLRGEDSVVLVNKAELEAWQETLDILTNLSEIKSVRKARKQKSAISHKAMLKEIGLDDATQV